MGGGVRRRSAQYKSNFERTVRRGENTTESHSAISSTFHTDMEKRNPHQSKTPHRRLEQTPASVTSPVYNTPYLSRTVKELW